MSGNAISSNYDGISNNPNRVLFEHADELQRKSTEVARRCQQQLAETEELGTVTLDEIRNQNKTLTRIHDSADMTNAKLDHTHKLLNRYDRWAFHWYGRNKRMAQRDGKQAKKEGKILEKQQQIEQQSKTDSSNKSSANHHAITARNQDYRSQLFSSSSSAPPRIRTVTTLPLDYDDDDDDVTVVVTPPPPPPPVLDDTTPDYYWRRINDQDEELDQAIDGMVESLDRLSHISKAMRDDISRGNQQMDQVVQKVDQVNYKQCVVNSRVRRNLNK